MSKIKQLLRNYSKHIVIPWRTDAAPAQRVIFCVYNEQHERALRARIDEFELETTRAGHSWFRFDLSDTFAEWLAGERYARKYFQAPELIDNLLPKYQDHLTKRFDEFIEVECPDADSVVAVSGVGSLFGLLKVRNVVDQFAPQVCGRLLVFFPGSFENNNYRLLDGYDGWNYLAVPITADKEI
ncbi:DUF1788 domain-containing protein [Spiribacter sp. 2438]|uniref:BREX protein BrxB domain-containing protein n=1 Tax=Spiribacter sp. 2438 TaxID=2666185 RepID=UPI0012B01D1D|nr:BREX protein BrxB domain-containing protein [Spiribacter sp. 2438]QGM21793.1 DUF1788 domain-containing protein [Spiribacter sp. 2438]